ncbi:hypothetical protein ACT47M_002452 [Cronobacter muytjensii]
MSAFAISNNSLFQRPQSYTAKTVQIMLYGMKIYSLLCDNIKQEQTVPQQKVKPQNLLIRNSDAYCEGYFSLQARDFKIKDYYLDDQAFADNVTTFYANLASSQTSLGRDIESAVAKKLWTLYLD